MRILIITQAADFHDELLGFFHAWVEGIARQNGRTEVICLKEGEHRFPETVRVHSLGKEQGKASKWRYSFRFLRTLWKLRGSYDVVFVHMNQEYVLLGGLFWKLSGIPIFLWRNHRKGSLLTRVAVSLSTKVFCTSPDAYVRRFNKVVLMPVGVDVNRYAVTGHPSGPPRILFFGRLSPVKRARLFIDALHVLHEKDFVADIIGSPINPGDKTYVNDLKMYAAPLVEKGKVVFSAGISHEETYTLYTRYSLYVNLTPDGSMDKIILEAMASATPVLVSNSAFRGDIPDACLLERDDAIHIAERLEKLLLLPVAARERIGMELRAYVERVHSFGALMQALQKEFSTART